MSPSITRQQKYNKRPPPISDDDSSDFDGEYVPAVVAKKKQKMATAAGKKGRAGGKRCSSAKKSDSAPEEDLGPTVEDMPSLTVEEIEDKRQRAAKALEVRFNQSGDTVADQENLTNEQKVLQMKLLRESKNEDKGESSLRVNIAKCAAASAEYYKQTRGGNVADENVEFFTCPELFGAESAQSKSESHLRNMLQGTRQEALDASVQMIYTFNTEDVYSPAVAMLKTYLQKIIDEPFESKYQSIRLFNKVFKEKVAGAKGAIEFLEAVEFARGWWEDEKTGADEEWLVLKDGKEVDELEVALLALSGGKPLTLKLVKWGEEEKEG